MNSKQHILNTLLNVMLLKQLYESIIENFCRYAILLKRVSHLWINGSLCSVFRSMWCFRTCRSATWK